ncbi:MAG: DNA polymerase I [Patescibacteria group bacterium]
MSRYIVIDGNAIVHRAYHALPPLTTKAGVMVNAVYGFTSMLLKVWHDLKPDCIAVTFDMAGPTFRHEKYKAYKATRVKADQELYDQIPLVHEVVKSFGLPVYEKKGYEADDVIGTIVKQLKDEVFIVTGDMDTLQLIRDGVKVYTLRKGMSDVVVYDEDEFKKKFGFGPELMVDYKALRGDASDNIPGVPGIGEKTAMELVQKFGTIENIYKKLKNDKKKIEAELKPGVIKKLVEGEDLAKMSKELSTIDCDVPDIKFDSEHCRIKEFDKEKINELFQKFEFVSLLKRVPGFMAAGEFGGTKKTKEKKIKAEEVKLVEIKNEEELKKLFKAIRERKSFAARAVLDNPEPLDANLLGIIFIAGPEAYFVGDNYLKKVWEIFSDKDLELVGHDLKDLVKVLKLKNVEIQNRIFDVMIASYLLNPGSRAHDIPSVVLKVLGKGLTAASGQESLFGIDKKSLAYELFLISQAKEKLSKDLEKADNLGLFNKIEMALIPVLAQMELNGIAVDLNLLKDLSKDVNEEIKSETKKIYEMAGTEFNIASPIQLREILFDRLGLSVIGIKKGKTGLSTSAEELEKLHGLHPIIEEVENYRELAKLQNTYIDVLPTLINKKTGRIHTHFNQAVAATGRLSSSDPNLQNIPIRTELGKKVRETFVSEPGNVLISADYSQIELRIVASMAQDKTMIEIFSKGEDIHKATAAAINGVPLQDVTPDMRYRAKEVNFGVLYGMGAYGLSWRTGISQAEAKDFIAKYFAAFSGVREYIARTLEFTKKEGYCETLFGRRRYIPELNASNHQLRAAAERMAINHPIQGTAADLMKMAMIEVEKEIAKLQKDGDIRMILQVHDELVLEVKKGLEEKVSKIVKEVMENVVKLRVPIEVGVNFGHSWGKLK